MVQYSTPFPISLCQLFIASYHCYNGNSTPKMFVINFKCSLTCLCCFEYLKISVNRFQMSVLHLLCVTGNSIFVFCLIQLTANSTAHLIFVLFFAMYIQWFIWFKLYLLRVISCYSVYIECRKFYNICFTSIIHASFEFSKNWF